MPGFRPKPSAPQLNRAHPFANGLKVAIPFAQGGGAAVDLASNRPATDMTYGSGGWVSSIYGWGLRANASRYVFANSDSYLGLGDCEFTLFLAMRAINVTTVMVTRSSQFGYQFRDDGWFFTVDTPGVDDLGIYIDTASGTLPIISNADWGGQGEKRMAVVRRLGGNYEFWSDGYLVGTATNTTGLSAIGTGMALTFGALETDQVSGDTGIYHAYYQWSRALSPVELAQLAFDPFAPVRPTMPLWVVADVGGGGDTYDESITLSAIATVMDASQLAALDAINLNSIAAITESSQAVLQDSVSLSASTSISASSQAIFSDALALGAIATITASSGAATYNESLTLGASASMQMLAGLIAEDAVTLAVASAVEASGGLLLDESLALDVAATVQQEASYVLSAQLGLPVSVSLLARPQIIATDTVVLRLVANLAATGEGGEAESAIIVYSANIEIRFVAAGDSAVRFVVMGDSDL